MNTNLTKAKKIKRAIHARKNCNLSDIKLYLAIFSCHYSVAGGIGTYFYLRVRFIVMAAMNTILFGFILV